MRVFDEKNLHRASNYAVGHATSEVSALLAGYISNVTPAMMQAFNEKIFIIPQI